MPDFWFSLPRPWWMLETCAASSTRPAPWSHPGPRPNKSCRVSSGNRGLAPLGGNMDTHRLYVKRSLKPCGNLTAARSCHHLLLVLYLCASVQWCSNLERLLQESRAGTDPAVSARHKAELAAAMSVLLQSGSPALPGSDTTNKRITRIIHQVLEQLGNALNSVEGSLSGAPASVHSQLLCRCCMLSGLPHCVGNLHLAEALTAHHIKCSCFHSGWARSFPSILT